MSFCLLPDSVTVPVSKSLDSNLFSQQRDGGYH